MANTLVEKLFGIHLKSDDKEAKQAAALKTFIPPNIKDGAVTIDQQAFGYGGYFYSSPYQARRIANEFELITKYRQMSMHPLVDRAIEEICNEAIVSDESGSYKLDLNLDDIESVSDNIKEKILEEFYDILRMCRYSTDAYSLFRQYYIDGRMFNLILIDENKKTEGIQEVRLFDPRQIQLVRNITRKNNQELAEYGGSSAGLVRLIDEVEEFFVYNPYGLYSTYVGQGIANSAEQIQGIRIEPSSVSYITSGLMDHENTIVLSHLEKAAIVLNQLTDLESAMVVYRLSRSSEKRIFYIDVGKMAHTKASQYLKSIAEKYRTKLTYDPATGKVTTKNNQINLTEDYFLPRREGSTGTEISTLAGGTAFDQIPDVDYFLKLLKSALSVPYSRMEASTGFSLGKSSEITRDEIAFKKFITRLQNKFGEFFIQLLKVQLELRGIMSSEEFEDIKQDIILDFQTDNFFFEMKESEILSIRADTAKSLGEVNEVHQVFSSKWIKQHIFKLTDDEISENDAQIKKERELRNLEHISNPENESTIENDTESGY